MRYIDADKLKEVFDEHEDDYGYLHGYWEEFIDNAPAADVRKNVRGEWILHIDDLFPEESTMECNQCHEHQPVTIDDNFCPNCGADMRGGKNG